MKRDLTGYLVEVEEWIYFEMTVNGTSARVTVSRVGYGSTHFIVATGTLSPSQTTGTNVRVSPTAAGQWPSSELDELSIHLP